MQEEGRNNWEILKERIREQISDCNKHRGASGNWGTCARLYGEILREMNRIENGHEKDFVPFNGLWKTKDEINAIVNEEDY